MMKSNGLRLIGVVLCLAILAISKKGVAQTAIDEKLDWKLAVHAYCFKLFSLAETLEKLSHIGVKYVELYPNQLIYPDKGLKSHFSLLADNEKPIKDLLEKYGITPVTYGVVRGSNEVEWIQIFEFAKAFNIGMLNIEPPYDQLPMIGKLAGQYQIKVAIHNHAIPSAYWHPQLVKLQIAGTGPWVGACGDIGHWVRSGLDPLDCAAILEENLLSFHLKDLRNAGTKDTHDVPWGTGVCNIAGLLRRLKDRKVSELIFTVEYEYNWEDNLSEIEQSIAYYQRVIGQMQHEN